MTTVSATVSRTSLSLSPLSITSAPYEIMGAEDSAGAGSGLDPGQTVFSRVWATAAYVAGGVQVWSVPGIVSATLKLYAIDSSQANLEADLVPLIAALTQPSFTLTIEIDAATYAWACNNADYQADAYPQEMVIGMRWGITFTIPRSPIPVSGPI